MDGIDHPMIGRFLEISLATRDIRASVEFYEALGFVQTTTNDTLLHPYGVLTDGHICIGVHQLRMASPTLTFVLPAVAAQLRALEAQGIAFTACQTGPEEFHRASFSDPGGQMVALIEARTYSPPGAQAERVPLCGRFDAMSIPERDLEAAQRFWVQLGFTAGSERERPYPSVRLLHHGFALELHKGRALDAPMLVFTAANMRERIAALRARQITFVDGLPRGLEPRENAMLEAPEGTILLLLTEPQGG
jgi:catechol 2,3-dioxygenase-like lactoylglutathione lyase family enzyme